MNKYRVTLRWDDVLIGIQEILEGQPLGERLDYYVRFDPEEVGRTLTIHESTLLIIQFHAL